MDQSKQYILSCIQALLALANQPQGLANSQHIDNFLLRAEKKSLTLQYQQGKGLKIFNPSNQEAYQDGVKLVSILKVGADVISDDNFQKHLSIQLISGGQSVNDFHAQLSNFYLPLLGSRVDDSIKKLLNELKQQMDNSIIGASYSQESDQDQNDVSRINKPSDEIEYWIRLGSSYSVTESESKRISAINQIFAKISKPWKEYKTLELNNFKDLLDQTGCDIQNILSIVEVMDELITSMISYPEKRFSHLIKLISTAITYKLESVFPNGQAIFTTSASFNVKLKLTEGQRLAKLLLDTLKQYLELDWKPHLKGELDLSELDSTSKRINDVFELRNVLEELMKVQGLPIDVDEIFKELWEIGPFTSNSTMWAPAIKKVQINIEQLEQDLIKFLKQEVFNTSGIRDNPLQTIRDMQKWQGLLSRPAIQKYFTNDREQVVMSMVTVLDRIKEEFTSRSGAALLDSALGGDQSLPYNVNFSKILHQIVWVKSLNGKVKKILTISQMLLSDLKKSNQFFTECQQILLQMQQFEQESFDQWKQEVMAILKNPDNELALQISGKLMEIDLDEGILKVNYSEKLVTLIKEVRQLCELGFRKQIPKQIIEITEIGRKYYKEALTLKQVANFYNQMSDQIFESQRPLLVEQAVNFENIVKNMRVSQKKKTQAGFITWDNAEELESYISRIQEAVNAISNENRRLRKIHQSILDTVIQLFDIDLLKQKNLWKDKMDQIRKYIDIACSGKDLALCKSWKIHWDYQVFKALEFQYQRGFQTLQSNVNEIQADVIMRNGQISFKPPIEELREKYYTEIRNFISFPATQFQGVGGFPDLFKQMPEKNASYVNVVYNRAEDLFSKLEKLLSNFEHWALVQTLDPELVQALLPDLDSWEIFMKEVRVKRKDLEKINDIQKVDCFSIILTSFKVQVDDALQKLVEGMMSELKNQIKLDCDEISVFLSSSQQRLSKRPSTMQEMTEAQVIYLEVKGQKFENQKRLDQCIAKNKLIMNLSSSTQNQQLVQVQKNWENFELLIGDFDSILSEQTKQIKADMKTRSKDLNSEIEKFYSRYTAMKPKQVTEMDRDTATEMAESMAQWRKQWKELEEKVDGLTKDHDHFEMPRPEFPIFKQIQEELKDQEATWEFYDQFNTKLSELSKEDWFGFRNKLYLFQELLTGQQDLLKQSIQQNKLNKKDPVVNYLTKQLDLYLKIYPLLKLLVGEAFEPEHWTSLFSILKMKDMKREKLLFNDLITQDKLLLKQANAIKELQARAQGEVTLREAIIELQGWCDNAEFELTEYTSNNRTTPLIKEWKELMTKVSDNQSLLESLKESKFIKRFSEQVESFEGKLGGIDDYLSKLNIIQRKWVYLEPIFLRGALPQEQGRFKRLDDDYRTIMLGIQRDSKVVSLCGIPGIKDTLETILDQLERCQKALNDFLEEKRGKFPRFYFLGDDDLLEILGQSQNPQVIQMHLKKLFGGIHQVEFNKENTEIYSMVSSAKESVKLNSSIVVDEVVENWLAILSNNMIQTLTDSLIQCLKEKQLEFGKYPSQILCLSEEIKFTDSALSAVKSQKLQNCKNDHLKLLENLTILNGQTSSNPLVQLKLKSLILDLIHHIDVLDQLILNQVQSLSDWHWIKQLKFEFNTKKGISEIIMVRARFDYTYEYQGNAPKLVHTPLTDKCYLTLTQGMSMGYGGNPYGPAGTGKTESVKALGQLFGRQVLVFNCDEGIDFKSMGRIFIGLVKCGAWGCFDEFNRLLEEQLSAISQQIQVIQHAIKENLPTMVLMGQSILVSRNSGIFVTLNPAGKHYGGRSKLPDNLKQLFRPVAMSVPDNELIAEVLLYSEGFKYAKQLAEKVITIFTLARQLLSPQQHYDWGLRALKTILTVAGQIIQDERQKQEITPQIEAELLIKAIRINTMSKLTFSDTKKFVQLVNDVFPGTKSEDIVYEKLTLAVKDVLQSMKLDVIDNQISKILQFYEATKQRMGVVLVGPSGCGKTTIWRVLKKAHEKMGTIVKTHVMNPKSMPRSQLLGNMNNDTREFSEGVLTASARLVVKEPAEVLNWIICDGDIDPEWIESLNSVLDDNHLLTLPTGERISFQSNVNFIFETSDLQYASPATVSRMGMIFLNNEDISIKSLINRWVSKLSCPEDQQRKISEWIDTYFYQTFEFVQQIEDKQCVPTTRIGMVFNVLSQLARLPQSKQQFIYYMLLGFCSNFQNEMRSRIAQFIFQASGDKPPVDLSKQPIDFQCGQNYETYKYMPTQLDQQQFNDADNPPVIMTIFHQRDLQVINGWVDQCEPFLVVGNEGCGKNLLIQSAFSILKKKMKIQIAIIHCNAQTGAAQIIQKLNQVCLKASSAIGRVYKPKECSRLILYLKDINLPKPDKYQTIQLIAFLQQLITYRGFYDDNLEFVYLDEKIQIVASMNPPSTVGRHPLATRFTANVKVHYIEPPEELSTIYTEYLKVITPQMSTQFSQLLVEFYKIIVTKFTPDEHRHYQFTPRNLTQIVFGLQRYERSQEMEAIMNEINRNFRDRLVTPEAKNKFDTITQQLIKQIFKSQLTQSFYGTALNLTMLSKLEKNDFKTLMQKAVTQYSREQKEVQLYLVDEVLELMASLNRLLSAKTGAWVLLAGRSGIGRKMCCQIMSTMLQLEFFQPYTARDYSLREFRKDLRNYMEIAAIQNKPGILYLEDHVLLQHKSILETVNSLLASGEVPGLFAQEEMERLFPNPEEVKQEFYGKTLYEAFLERVKRNLKIVLAMDWENKEFTQNCAANPAIFTKCTIIWLHQLSKESLTFITQQELQETVLKDLQQNDFVNNLVQLHRQGIGEAPPRAFWALLNTFQNIYSKKLQSRGSQANHLKIGLAKLHEAKDLVDQLTSEAQEKKKLLSKKQAEADQALSEISKAMQNAAERRQETEQLQKFLQEEEGKIQGSKKRVETELAEVTPIVQEAQSAVKGIQKSNLDELKSLKMPPEPIHNVLTAVMKVFKQNDMTWNGMKKFLANRGVIEQIVDFDPRMITPDIRSEVEEVLTKYSNSFEKQVIYRASLAAGPLAEWVKAVLKYATVLEKIAPLENELSKLFKKLESSRNRLKQCEEQLKQLDTKVQQLKEDFGRKTSEAEILKTDLKKAEETVGLASNLLDKLSDEKIRWQNQFDQISLEVKQFPTDSLLSAGYTVYLSQSDENMRSQILQEWKRLSAKYDYVRFMSSESEQLKWKSQGLPGDQLSIENSIMVFNCSKIPLLIDPNTQASEWLKKNLSSCETLSQQDPKFGTQLELSVRFGKTLVIQELDSIEGLLVPLLKHDLVHQGPRWVVMVGEKAVDYNEGFRLFLTTRNSAIHLPPHTQSLIQVVNYTVTRSGLEGKLLSIIINIEQPELEEKKQKFLENEEGLKMQLSELERTLLEELANASGNILENRVLIESLNQTKSKSKVIAKSLQESSELQSDLDKQREVYQGLAQKGASLFILISDLQKVNNMYRYSLAYFIRIFKKCLEIKEKFDTTIQKLDLAGNNLIKNVINQIAASLFKNDRLMFSLHLTKGIKPELIAQAEWDFLLGNIVSIEGKGQLPKWAQPERKEIYSTFLTAIPKLAQTVNFNDKEWENWSQQSECEKQFPQSVKLTPFQKMLTVYVFRPERIQSALSNFIQDALQITSVSGQTFSFKQIFQTEINSKTPCLFVVSAGSDPSKELEEFAESEVGRENFQELSMGGNQNDVALQMIQEAATKGQWLCLKNLHLVISFLPTLEKNFKALEPHQNFRLWLTTEAHDRFPSILLESCFKVSYESPPGLKKNLVRIMQSWPNNFLGTGSTQRAQLMFILTWFHALIQERRTYIPQGWSKFYEFSYGDYRAGQQIIENLINDAQNGVISWPTLYGLYENAIYGGRIDNDQDIKVLQAYMHSYFNTKMLQQGTLSVGGPLPTNNQLKEYIALVNKMPETDNPKSFGLPQNIDKAVQRYAIQGVIFGLKSMSSIVGQDLKFEKEKWTQMLNPIINLWGQLSKIVKDGGQLQITQKQQLSDDPVDSFVYLEVQQAQLLFEKIDFIFEQLKQVLYQNGLLTTEIIETGMTFIRDGVPPSWSNLWEGPDTITSWLKGFCKKMTALKKWVEKTQKQSILNNPIDLSELFHPEVFLNALRQKTARKLKVPLNELKLMSDFDDSKLKSPITVKLNGLLLQGCGFADSKFIDPPQNMGEFIPLPQLGVCFVGKKENDLYPADQTGEFPVFTNSQREKLLCRFKLLNEGSISERILAGVAIFLSQND